MVLKRRRLRGTFRFFQTMSFTMNDIGMVTCCATAEGYVSNMESNPTCAGSEAPPPAPVSAPVEPPIPTVIDNIDANTPMTIGGSSSPGMPDAAASCEALESQFQD